MYGPLHVISFQKMHTISSLVQFFTKKSSLPKELCIVQSILQNRPYKLQLVFASTNYRKLRGLSVFWSLNVRRVIQKNIYFPRGYKTFIYPSMNCLELFCTTMAVVGHSSSWRFLNERVNSSFAKLHTSFWCCMITSFVNEFAQS